MSLPSWEEYSEPKASEADWGALTELSERVSLAQERVAQLEEELRAAKEEARRLTEVTLPEAMLSMNVGEVRNPAGFGFKLEDFLYTNVRKDDRPRAFKFLKDRGYGHIVRRKYNFSFLGEGDENEAALMSWMRDRRNLEVAIQDYVHPSTLRAAVTSMVKEFESREEPFPEELFGIHRGVRAVHLK